VVAQPRPAAPLRPDPQWMYKTVHSDAELNALTASGWQLVTMNSDSQGQHYLLKISKDLIVPWLLQKVEPDYTEQAYTKHVEGDVVLSCVVTSEGRPTNIKVTKPLDPGLDASAIAAVQQWVFKPGVLNGQAVIDKQPHPMQSSSRSRS
jgi:TonB family protein